MPEVRDKAAVTTGPLWMRLNINRSLDHRLMLVNLNSTILYSMLCAAFEYGKPSWQVCTRGIGEVKSPG